MSYDVGSVLPPLVLRSHHPDSRKEIVLKIPIINGGMGVGITGPKLASAVTNAGGGGLLTGVALGYPFQEMLSLFRDQKPFEANKLALAKWIKDAKKLARDNFIGVNIMVAVQDFKDLALTAAKEKIDLIVAGAGLPIVLPEIVKDYPNTMIAPIISSVKAARIIIKRWISKGRIPDAIVYESIHHSGGHQGSSIEDILGKKNLPEDVIPETRRMMDEMGIADTPLIAAGGIWNKVDIVDMLNMGAQGVQMASRFLLTEEAGFEFGGISTFKSQYINNQKETILVHSPAGLPGRAINTQFSKQYDYDSDSIEKEPHNCPFACLSSCDKKLSIYCILDHLTKALKGDKEKGLFFAGSNIGNPKLQKEIVPVKELMRKLSVGENVKARTEG